jgi:hypothetical protein
VLSITLQTETTEAKQRYNDTTEFIKIQQQDKELESMNKDAILKQEPRACQTAYLNQVCIDTNQVCIDTKSTKSV